MFLGPKFWFHLKKNKAKNYLNIFKEFAFNMGTKNKQTNKKVH